LEVKQRGEGMGLLDFLKKKPKDQEVVNESKEEFDEETMMDTYVKEFRVVGVTFNNDDGTSRQRLLRKIKQEKRPFNKEQNVVLEQYIFRGQPAISVEVNGFQIGNIPKEDVSFIIENADKIVGIDDLFVGLGESCYYARLKVIIKR
jgi:CTP-dependent riboflavin kinase